MKRWLKRLTILAVVLLVGVLVTAHLVLRSDLPRTIVLDVLREQTGLRIDASQFQTSWFGRTTIVDLSIGLPMQDQPFMTVPEIRVSHSALLRILATRTVELHTLTIDEPSIRLEAQPDGQWNLIEAADIVSLTRQGTARASAGGRVPSLPALRIENAVVEVVMPDGSVERYEPLTIQGDPADHSAWDFRLSLTDRLAVGGRLSPNTGWSHEVNFDIDEIRSMVEPFAAELPDRFHVAGTWQGQIRGSDLTGTLSLDNLHYDQFDASARVGVRVRGFEVEMVPHSITVRDAALPDVASLDRLRVSGGRVTLSREGFALDRVTATAAGMLAQIDGEWSMDRAAGELRARWRALGEGPSAHAGHASVSLVLTPLSTIELSASAESHGQIAATSWDAGVNLNASGESWRSLRATLEAPRLSVEIADASADLAGTRTRLQIDWPFVKLTDLRVPDAQGELSTAPARLEGLLDAESFEWVLAFTADNWAPPATLGSKQASPLTMLLDLSGDRERARLTHANIRYADYALDASGSLAMANLVLDMQADARAERSQSLGSLAASSLQVQTRVQGGLSPLNLQVEGTIEAGGVTYEDQAINPLRIPYTVSVGPDRADFATSRFTMLGGDVVIRGDYQLDTAIASADIRVESLDLNRLTTLAGIPTPISGSASATMISTVPVNSPTDTQLIGNWTVSDMRAPGLGVVSGGGRAQINNRRARFADMRLTSAQGVLAGSAHIELDRPDLLKAELVLTDWPLRIDAYDLAVVAQGSTHLELNLAEVTAMGEADLDLDITLGGQPLASVSTLAEINERRLDLSQMRASLFGGDASGKGTLFLDEDRWTDSTLDLEWSGIDFTEASRFSELLEPLSGVSSGTIAMQRNTDQRATLPMQIEIISRFDEMNFQRLTIGSNRSDEPDLNALVLFGPRLIQIDKGTLAAADGQIDLFGRITIHDSETAVFVNLTLNQVDLQQLASAARLEDRPMPGRVNGEWTVGGTLEPPHRVFGSARLLLSDSELLALPGIAQLYGALRLNIGNSQPTGEGEMILRFEGNALEITRLTYFNRGTDILAGLRIENFWQASDSPISGTAVGAIRPLRGTNLPFFEIVDRLIGAAQSNAAAVDISGTLSKPDTQVLPLQEITSAIRRLIVA